MTGDSVLFASMIQINILLKWGENMKVVCKRFLDSGLTPEEVAKRMCVPMKFVNAWLR